MRRMMGYVLAMLGFGGFIAGCSGPKPQVAVSAGGQEHLHPALKMEAVPAGLGVNIHFYKGSEVDWRMMQEAGVGIVRMDIGWGGVEKKPGEYDFTHHDELVKELERRGMRLLFIIDYGNPLYDKGLSPHSDECRAAYARFCAAIARRYAGKKIIWELWNEPNISFWTPKPNVKDYVAWCKAVVPAIRQADPNACIIGPATSGIQMAFLEGCFKDGFLDLVDGVSVHPYRGDKAGPETAIREYGKLRQSIDRYKPAGKAIPILSGEWGYSTASMSPETQGKYLARQWLTNLGYDLPISIWYDWHDDGPDPKEREHNFGTVRTDYRPKPAYIAMKTLTQELRGFHAMGRVSLGDSDDYLMVFRKGEDVTLAVWTTGKPHEVNLGNGIRVASAVDHTGKPISVQQVSRWTVSDAPQYLRLGRPVPKALLVKSRGLAAARPVSAGVPNDLVIRLPLSNPTEAPIRVCVADLKAEGLEGDWQGGNGVALAAGQSVEALWRGRVVRRDRETLRTDVSYRVEGDGEGSFQLSQPVEVSVQDRLSLQVAARHDGVWVIASSPCSTSLRGMMIPRVDGVDRRPVPVVMDPPAKTTELPLHDVTLTGVPRHISIRLVDDGGRLLAESEPMTYYLVDPVTAPVATDAGQYYNLWHEGDEKRTATLIGRIVDSPGENPPFSRAVRLDYEMGAGWCFWQCGPKAAREMCAAEPRRVSAWVYGDGSGDLVRCRTVDSGGQAFQPAGEAIVWTGWRLVELSFDSGFGHWGGAGDGIMRPPFRWTSYYLHDSASRTAHKGTVYLSGVMAAW